jgi:hypothetical protein
MTSGDRRRKNKKAPKTRGKFGFSVPAAGAMVGLGRNASYEAAKNGEIPTIPFGRLLVVPRIPWLRKLGVVVAQKTAIEAAE